MSADSEHWADYYAVTVERPAWRTVRLAIDKFRREDEAAVGPDARDANPPARSRRAMPS